MNPLEFLDLANDWSVGAREGEWRSSISRAYYAVFHVARDLPHAARLILKWDRVGYSSPPEKVGPEPEAD